MALENNIKEFRTTKKLTQLELSKLLEISPRTLSLIESGDYNLSTILAIKIAKVFEVSVEDIFNLVEDQKIEEKDTTKDTIKKNIKPIVLVFLGLLVGTIAIQTTVILLGYTGTDSIENIRYFLIQNAQWLYVANFIFLFFAILFFMQGKKLVEKINDENEDIYEMANTKLLISRRYIDIFSTLTFVFLVIAKSGSQNIFGIFLFQLVAVSILQYSVIKQSNKLTSNTNENLVTIKKRTDNDDERIKQIRGDSALKSMITMQIAMASLMGASIALSSRMDTLFTAIAIGILWLVQNQSYINMAIKLEKRK